MTAQLNAARKLLQAGQGSISAGVTVRLWDGSTVEFNRSSAENIVVEIGSAASVRTLLFSPNVGTLFGLYGRGALGIVNASPLMLLQALDHVSILNFIKAYGRINLLKILAPFLAAEGQGFSPRSFLAGWSGKNRNDNAMI